jgi:hypothetical protein
MQRPSSDADQNPSLLLWELGFSLVRFSPWRVTEFAAEAAQVRKSWDSRIKKARERVNQVATLPDSPPWWWKKARELLQEAFRAGLRHWLREVAEPFDGLLVEGPDDLRALCGLHLQALEVIKDAHPACWGHFQEWRKVSDPDGPELIRARVLVPWTDGSLLNKALPLLADAAPEPSVPSQQVEWEALEGFTCRPAEEGALEVAAQEHCRMVAVTLWKYLRPLALQLKGNYPPEPLDFPLGQAACRNLIDQVISWCNEQESSRPGPTDSDGRAHSDTPSQKEALTHPDSHKTPQQWQFVRSGSGYFVAGFGEGGFVKGLLGFKYLAELLAHPHKPVPMEQLIGLTRSERLTPDRRKTLQRGKPLKGYSEDEAHRLELEARTPQPAIDDVGLQQLNQRLAEIEEAMTSAGKLHDQTALDLLTQDRERILEYLRTGKQLFNKVRDLNSKIDTHRTSIHGALRRAYEELRKASPSMKKLAQHFDLTITSTGGAFIYQPENPLGWAL